MLTIIPLDWDSNFFKQKIGKVQADKLSPNLIPRIEAEKKLQGYDLVYLFVNDIGGQDIKMHEEIGERLVDKKVAYGKKLIHSGSNQIHIEPFEGKVSPKLFELAIASGHKSRFVRDPRTTVHFPGLYRIWIENSVNKSVADEVMVSKYNSEITGFVTLKKNGNTGSIGLIAVDEKMRGMGIGKELLIAADNWYVSNNCDEATVVTQKDNQQACVLYEKAGYTINNIQFIIHL